MSGGVKASFRRTEGTPPNGLGMSIHYPPVKGLGSPEICCGFSSSLLSNFLFNFTICLQVDNSFTWLKMLWVQKSVAWSLSPCPPEATAIALSRVIFYSLISQLLKQNLKCFRYRNNTHYSTVKKTKRTRKFSIRINRIGFTRPHSWSWPFLSICTWL